jgi:hypothetical protein
MAVRADQLRPRVAREGRGVRSARGTSVTEVMLLTWLMLVFFAAALQIFIMNESLFRSLTSTHAQMFQYGFEHNGWKNQDRYKYNTDTNAKVIWRFQDFPEIRVQVLGMFTAWSSQAGFKGANGGQTIDIQSNVRGVEPDKGCGTYPCKKIKMGAGAAGPTDEPKEYMSRVIDFGAYGRLISKVIDSIGDFAGNL